MIIIDTQEKMNALLPEDRKYSIADLYNSSKRFNGILFKGIKFDELVYFDFFKSVDSFTDVIFQDCTFSDTSINVLEVYVINKIIIDSCKFNRVEVTLKNNGLKPKIVLRSILSNEDFILTPNNSGITLVNCNLSGVYLGYSNKYPLIISGGKIKKVYLMKGNESYFRSNDVVINKTEIGKLVFDEYGTGIDNIRKGGSTYNSIFNNPDIENIELDCLISECDLSGVNLHNASFTNRNKGFDECNLDGADFREASFGTDVERMSFYLSFYDCTGLDTMKIPDNMRFMQTTDNEYSLVFKDEV